MAEPVLTPEAEQASREAVHAARDAAQALETSRQQQMEDIAQKVQERFENVLARGTEQEKSIILARVPYICQDVKSIKLSLTDIQGMIGGFNEKMEKKYVTQEQFSPYKWVSGIVASVVITGIVASLLAKIFI